MRTLVILVTGGLGFIGCEVTRQAVAAGHKVRVVDDCSGNVVTREAVWQHAEAVWVGPVQSCPPAVAAGVDAVIHCASPVGAAGVIGRDCVTEITDATGAAIRIAGQAGACLVNVSTSEVYGTSGVNHEQDACVVPPRRTARVGYAVGKLAGEHQVQHAARGGLRAVSVRPFNVVGPLQAPGKGFVLPRLCQQAWLGDPLTVFGDGLQARAFTHVQDVARLLLHLASAPEVLDGRVLNAGNADNQTSILRLAEAVRAEVRAHGGPWSPIMYLDGQDVFGVGWEEASAGTKLPDSLAARRLGWKPRIDLHGIVAESVDFHAPRRVAA